MRISLSRFVYLLRKFVMMWRRCPQEERLLRVLGRATAADERLRVGHVASPDSDRLPTARGPRTQIESTTWLDSDRLGNVKRGRR